MYGKIQKDLQKQLEAIVNDGLYKTERAISTPQGAEIKANGKKVLNFCANNYLGLSSHPAVLEAG
ncbi:MAG TPA: glycine C-acetyltransferase, partial [Tenuifilaceae bacterium]|nr:glycine C-acetyltransferase [Tenuifilaceae bacterium]